MSELTKQELDVFGRSVRSRLSEYFDGFVLVGFVAGTQQGVVITPNEIDTKTRIALSATLLNAAKVMGGTQ